MSTDCGELRLGATILRKEKDLQPQKDDTQGTMGTGHSPGTPALTVAGFPVGQQPVASGAEAAVAARAVPALVLALVQCLTLVEICGMRGVKVREEDQSPLVPLPWASLALTSPSQHSKNHRAQSDGQGSKKDTRSLLGTKQSLNSLQHPLPSTLTGAGAIPPDVARGAGGGPGSPRCILGHTAQGQPAVPGPSPRAAARALPAQGSVPGLAARCVPSVHPRRAAPPARQHGLASGAQALVGAPQVAALEGARRGEIQALVDICGRKEVRSCGWMEELRLEQGRGCDHGP